MKVSLLTQIAPENKLLYRLKPVADGSVNAFIVVSFIQSEGLKHLFNSLKKLLVADKKITIYTSGYMGITDPKALEELLVLMGHYRNLNVYFNLSDRFHPKYLVFNKPNNKYVLFLGSSNISEGGLAEVGELNIQVNGNKTDTLYKDLSIVINALKKGRSFKLLDEQLINEYSIIYKKTKRTIKIKLPKGEQRPKPSLPPLEKMVIYKTLGYFSEKEMDAVDEKQPKWKEFITWLPMLKNLTEGDYFLNISKITGEKRSFCVCKYIEEDRIRGVGRIAHIKSNGELALNKLLKLLNINERALFKEKALDIYGIAILRMHYKSAFNL